MSDSRNWSNDDSVILRLVRAPITFGHTQFVMERDNNDSHGESFIKSASHLGNAIDAMHKCITKERLDEFQALARVTHSAGKLLKVLVLRASASEHVEKVLKIHLVPYCESHRGDCLRRFEQQHRVLPDTPGGLLGWIGTQEDRADSWEVDYPREDKLNQWAEKILRLPELSKLLQKALNGDA